VTPRPTDRIRIGSGVSAREFDGEWIVLDLSGGNYFGLDEIGGAIWQGLQEKKSLEEIAHALAARYDAVESVILDDVLALVGELLERRLVEIGP
jgi:Coenzyme PQQ synthesis protein D (PqqD)